MPQVKTLREWLKEHKPEEELDITFLDKNNQEIDDYTTVEDALANYSDKLLNSHVIIGKIIDEQVNVYYVNCRIQ